MALSRPLAERPARSSPRLDAAKLRAVRAREAALAARSRLAPRFRANVSVTSFTVNTTVDSALANPNSKACVDAANGRCSLRAAVEAADNRNTAVAVYLPAGTYVLTTATALDDTDPGGLSITGPGAASTTIKGDGSGILEVAPVSKAPSAVLFLTGLTLTDGNDTDGRA